MQTEKWSDLATAARDAGRQLVMVLKVDTRANKKEIKEAVQKLFKVKVDHVRTANFQGKIKRLGRSRGQRPGWKKAYITLKEGERLPDFLQI
jgi:large subunit ribosomal protein L23